VTYEKFAASAVLLLAVVAIRCSNGTETDNPVGPTVSLQGSQCHHEGTSHDSGPPPNTSTGVSGVGTSAAKLEVAGDYTRLACVAWQRDAGELHVSIRNLRAGCGIVWGTSAVTVTGHDVELDAHNPECRVARCGNCFYDLEFDVEGAPESGDLNVTASVTDEDGKWCHDGAPGIEIDREAFSIPEGEESGVRCRRLEPFLFMPPPAECERYAACSDACTCASGTRCAPNDGQWDETTLCVPECTMASECPVPGAFECVDGSCKTKPW
jgi:hypothetical protein